MYSYNSYNYDSTISVITQICPSTGTTLFRATILLPQVPYVVAHRHAAGNFATGTLLVKLSAAAKIGKARAGSPRLGRLG
jgi:hypothetical protein